MSSILLNFALVADAPVIKPVLEGILEGNKGFIYFGGTYRPKPAFGDLDGDGDPDLLIGDQQAGVAGFRNNGSSKAASWTFLGSNYMNTSYTLSLCTPAFCDIDADGDMDVFIGSRNQSILFYRNDVGSFAAPEDFAPTYTEAPTFGDLDGDGDFDMLVGGRYYGAMYFRNDGTPQNPQMTFVGDCFGISSGLRDQAFPELVDIDGDGDLDCLLGACSEYEDQGNSIYFYENTGTKTAPQFTLRDTDFLEATSKHEPTRSDMTMRAVDLDGDWDYDLVLADYMRILGVYKNTGSSTNPVWTWEPGLLPQIESYALGTHCFYDIDDDGDLDLFYGTWPKSIGFYRNVGSPTNAVWKLENEKCATIPDSIVCYQAYSPKICDIDGDGDGDLFVAVSDGNVNSWIFMFENIGTPAEPAWSDDPAHYANRWQDISYSNWFYGFAFGDLDNDGDFDIVAPQSSPDAYIALYQNIGSANVPQYAAPVLLVTPEFSPVYAHGHKAVPFLSDMDNDGDLDLLVAATAHSGQSVTWVNYWENKGTPSACDFNGGPVTGNILPADMHSPYGTVVANDLNGDGHNDILYSDMRGGIFHYQQVADNLLISPQNKTVVSGQKITFDVSGNTGATSWQIIQNRSGGSIVPAGTTAEYTAGAVTGVVDVIKVSDSINGFAPAYVNIISASQISASGKAVIMAGRKPNDPLWQSTEYLAGYIYQTLLYRGFSPDNIYFLSCETGSGVDAPSSLANIQTALTTWAQGSPNLFIYFIDHGQEQSDDVYIRCNETDVLYASTLNQWLNDLQESGTDMLTLVVDCCQSGGFISQCRATGSHQRIVVASTDAGEPAFFSAGGLISFTETFVNALYSGLTIGYAFDLASGAMDPYQRPQLDDDGNGIYHKESDGALARTITLGATFIAGADRPQIGQVSPNQTLTGGDTQATIWASEVSSVYPVNKVWATIAPPNFIPVAQNDPASPVLGLPRMELAWNAGTNRYEATTDTFTMLGAYAVNLYAEDIWGGVSYPKQVYVNQVQSDERIIIICGDGDHDDDSPWAFSDYIAEAVYNTAKVRWLVDSRITYLSSGVHAGVDQLPTKANLLTAIGAASGISKITVFMIGKGNDSAFDINGDGPSADDLTPDELNAALDNLQDAGDTCVIAVLDFHQSGAWIAPLQAPAGKERIIIASCGADEASWREGGGIISFSQWFFSGIFSGLNIRDALNRSRNAMRGITGNRQNPQLDDDGSGISDWRDGVLAVNTYIGAAFVTGYGAPFINDYAKHVKLQSQTATLWASGVWSGSGILEVFAHIIPQDATSESGEVLKIPFNFNADLGRYEAIWNHFDPRKYYEVIYYARGRNGELSKPYKTTYHGWGNHDVYDKYFDDNDIGTLNYCSASGIIQMHNFMEPEDADYIVFHADPDSWYSVNVFEQARNCDAAIYLYADDISSGSLVIRDDFGPGGDDELLSWYSGSRNGPMYVKITQSQRSSDLFGDETTYTLRMSGDWGPSGGLATITMAVENIGPDGGVLKAGDNGIYSKPQISIPTGGLTQERELFIKSPGDIGNNPQFDFTKEWLASHPSNASITMILSDPVDFEIPARLTLQFIDNGPTFENHNFTIDDVPEGSSLSDMRIYSWTGNQWNVLPGEHIIEADTVSAEIGSLSGRAIFAVAPFTDARVASWWLY